MSKQVVETECSKEFNDQNEEIRERNKQMVRYLAGRSERIGNRRWGSEENAYDMAVHDPDLFQYVYDEDASSFVAKYEHSTAERAELAQKYKDCTLTARMVD